MKTALLSFLLSVPLARADMWLIVDTRTTNAIPAKGEARMVDVADQGDRWQVYRTKGGENPMQIPAWFDSEDNAYSFATTYTGAVADLSSASRGSPERKALRQWMVGQGFGTPKGTNIFNANRVLRLGVATATTFAIHRVAETNRTHFLDLLEAFENSKTDN